MKEELHVIFGISGGIGKSVALELLNRGKQVRGINRSGKSDLHESMEIISADIMDIEQAVIAAEGATHIYNCVNVSYEKWSQLYPEVAFKFIEILRNTQAKGIIADNLYAYGEDISEPLNENMPYNSKNKKGIMRAKTAAIYEDAMKDDIITATIVRAPDFYGPGVEGSSFYGDRVFPNILSGKNVSVFGNLDVPHAMIYIKDYAKAIVTLALNEKSYGQTWHAPMDEPLTQREYLEMLYELAGTSGKISTFPSIMLKLLKHFVPILREIDEMMYEWENPYYVSSEKYKSTFEFTITPHREALQETLSWYRDNNLANN